MATRHSLYAALWVALLCCALLGRLAHADQQLAAGGSPFANWLGTYWGHCIQYAYQDPDNSEWQCSQYPVSYPYKVVIGKYRDDPTQAWQYKISFYNDKVEITHDGASPDTYGVVANSYEYLPLYYDYYKYNAYCLHTVDANGLSAYFGVTVGKSYGLYTYNEWGLYYFHPNGNTISQCPKKDLSLACNSYKGYYGYKCTAYKVNSNY